MTDAIDDALLSGLPIGMTQRSQGRTLSSGEIAVLNSLNWVTGELHTNREFVRNKTEFQALLVPGPVIIGIIVGLANQSFWRPFVQEYRIEGLAGLGIEASFRAPVYPDDTLWVDTRLESARRTKSKSGRGVMVLIHSGVNQDGRVVAEVREMILFARRQV